MTAKRSWLTPKEVADVVGYCDHHVRLLCRQGKIAGAFKAHPAGDWRIPASWVELYEAQNVDNLIDLDEHTHR